MKEKLLIGLIVIGVLVGGFLFLELGKIAGIAMVNAGWI